MPERNVVPVTFFVSGRGRLFQRTVEAEDELTIAVRRCVLDTNAADLEPFCNRAGIAVTRLTGDRAGVRKQLSSIVPSMPAELAVLTFDRLIPDTAVAAWGSRMINVHMSLLPAFTGFHAVENAIASGAQFTGATVHEVSPVTDGGPIIAQYVTPIRPDDDAASVGAAIYGGLEPMLLQVLAWFAEGRVASALAGARAVMDARYGELPWSPSLERMDADE